MSNWLSYYASNKRFLFSSALLFFSLGFAYYGCLAGFFYSIIPLDPNELILRILFMIIFDGFCLFLMMLILADRNETLKNLGFFYIKHDVTRSILLCFFGFIITFSLTFPVAYFFMKSGHTLSGLSSADKYFQDLSKMPLALSIAMAVVNPLFEELIVRAYLMNELNHFFQKASVAVILSALIQSGYHLYQGWIPMGAHFVTFFFFSLYYQKTKRVFPLFLAHFYMDAIAILGPRVWPSMLDKLHSLR